MDTVFIRSAALATALVAGNVSTGHAASIATEKFEYTSATLAGQNGGSGFSGTWKSDLGLTTDSPTPVTSGSLAAPIGYVEAPAGNHASVAAGGAIVRSLASATELSLNDTQDIYISFITSRAAAEVQRVRFYSDSTLLFNVQVTSNGNVSFQGFGANTTYSTTKVPVNAPILWVVKLAASADENQDQAFVSYFSATEELIDEPPTSWFVTSNKATKTGPLNKVEFNAVGTALQVDELRIGTTWNDVAGAVVPEPSVMAMGIIAAAPLLMRRARR